MKLKMVVVALVLGGCSPVMNLGDGGDASVMGDVPSSRDVVADDASRDPMLVGVWQFTVPLAPPSATTQVTLVLEANGDGSITESVSGRADRVACDLTRTASRPFRWSNQTPTSVRVVWGPPCDFRVTDGNGRIVAADGGDCYNFCHFYQMMAVRIADYRFDDNGRLSVILDGETLRPYSRIR